MSKHKFFSFVFFLCLAWPVFSPGIASANPEYARATGKKCATCHEKSVPDRGRSISQIPSFNQGIAPKGHGPAAGFPAGSIVIAAALLAAFQYFAAILYSYRRSPQAKLPL